MPLEQQELRTTCSAPTNIAVIKYWGKDNVALNTPLNSSVSVTLNPDDLQTITTVVASREFKMHRLWLNGTEEPVSSNKRVMTVIHQLLALAQDRKDANGNIIVQKQDWTSYHFQIISKNTFPTAAGLASSASGYACLVGALSDLLCCKEEFPGQFSTIARQGSGSACRSLDGGFVKWQKGSRVDGSDSCAIQLKDENHWQELRAFICVVNDAKKETSSTNGMMTSKETSELLKFRAESIVENRIEQMEKAYGKKDFATFGKLMMQDSNQFHATCLDTYPPIFYLNSTSQKIISLVHQYNAYHNEIRAAYTFDAGPNAVLFVQQPDAAEFLHLLLECFPAPWFTLFNSYLVGEAVNVKSNAELQQYVGLEAKRGLVKKIYATRVGRGIKIVPEDEASNVSVDLIRPILCATVAFLAMFLHFR